MSLRTGALREVLQLNHALSTEQIILKMLPELANDASNPELKQAFQNHETDTRQQIEHLKYVFALLGETPKGSLDLLIAGGSRNT